MPYPIVPIDDYLSSMPIDELIKKITKPDIYDYLNEVLEYYGPPCEFCKHFNISCDKNIRNRKYTLRIGPYDYWHIRKFCDNHQSNLNDNEFNDNLTLAVSNSLNCNAQQYGTGN